MADDWCPFAIRLDGPPAKTGYNGAQKTHAKVGVTLHSMEYESEPAWDDATTLHNALFSGREASWTFSIVKFFGGSLLFQHYPIGAVCWAQGYQGNLWLDSIETEAIAPGKLTEPQFALLAKTLRWIREAHRWRYEWLEGGRGVTLGPSSPWLFEHNAVPGAPATNCAVFTHGQVDPVRVLAALQQEEDDMPTPQEIDEWESYTEGLLAELWFVHNFERAALLIAQLKDDLLACWRRGPAYPALDLPAYRQKLTGACNDVETALLQLKARGN